VEGAEGVEAAEERVRWRKKGHEEEGGVDEDGGTKRGRED
jgi:hypothetical protein